MTDNRNPQDYKTMVTLSIPTCNKLANALFFVTILDRQVNKFCIGT